MWGRARCGDGLSALVTQELGDARTKSRTHWVPACAGTTSKGGDRKGSRRAFRAGHREARRSWCQRSHSLGSHLRGNYERGAGAMKMEVRSTIAVLPRQTDPGGSGLCRELTVDIQPTTFGALEAADFVQAPCPFTTATPAGDEFDFRVIGIEQGGSQHA